MWHADVQQIVFCEAITERNAIFFQRASLKYGVRAYEYPLETSILERVHWKTRLYVYSKVYIYKYICSG